MHGDRRRALLVMAVLFAVSIAAVLWIALHHHDTLIKTPPPVVVSMTPAPQRSPRIAVRTPRLPQPAPPSGSTVTVTASSSPRPSPRPSTTTSPRPSPSPSPSVCLADHVCLPPPPVGT